MPRVFVGTGPDELPSRRLWEVHVGMDVFYVTHRVLHELFISLGMEVRAVRRYTVDSPHGLTTPLCDYRPRQASLLLWLNLAGPVLIAGTRGGVIGFANVGWLTGIIGLSLMPIAIGIAILRHRLYDIDVIINRALVYVPLTAIVAGIYTASIAISQRVLAATGQNSDIGIVLTTLVVVIVFTPIKNAVQATVDRRFKDVPTPPEQPRSASSDLTELLRELGELRGAGILTNDEFEAKKGDILARL